MRILKVFFIILFLFSFLMVREHSPSIKEAHAASNIQIDRATSTNSNTFSAWNHSIADRPDRILLVGTQEDGSLRGDVNSITCNNIPLTFLTSQDASWSTDRSITKVFYLVNPPTGTCRIRLFFASANFQDWAAGAVTLYNVDVNNPFGSVRGVAPSSGDNPVSITVPSTDPAQFIVAIASAHFTTLNERPGMDNLWAQEGNIDLDFFGSYGSSAPAQAGSTTLSWDSSSPNNSYFVSLVGMALNPAPLAPTFIPPTPTPQTYTISGNVFVDINKNLLKDVGENNYPAMPSIGCVNSGGNPAGNVIEQNDGSYTITNLPAGTYTVSYATYPIPVGYFMLYPENGPPPSFVVTVGPGCSVDGTTGAVCY